LQVGVVLELSPAASTGIVKAPSVRQVPSAIEARRIAVVVIKFLLGKMNVAAGEHRIPQVYSVGLLFFFASAHLHPSRYREPGLTNIS
jgi:uncharacterized membrane protein YhhN